MNSQVIKDNLTQQLSEMEMLESMFPNEIEYDDQFILTDIKQFIGKSSPTSEDIELLNNLSFSLKMEGCSISLSMPFSYPSNGGKVFYYIRSDLFDRTNQSKINSDLKSFMSDQMDNLSNGDLMIGLIISWIQENIENYSSVTEVDSSSKESRKETNESMLRLWIYSHHIYSKIKRKDILDLSRNYQISGFCLPGKPGIICLEGDSRNVQEMWSFIKSWNWKKINVKLQEEQSLRDKEIFSRFEKFEEISFLKSDNQQRDYHMDMGEFHKYLKNHGSDYIFKELFGFDKL